MKLFLDTASVDAVKKWQKTGLVDGITTNPTLLSKEGDNPKKVIQTLCDLLPNGEISVEVTEKGPEAVYKQAQRIAALAPNVVVKVPCHVDYYSVVDRLVQDDIAVNVTLVFSLPQAMFMAKLGATYVSPFIGRLDDSGADGVAIVKDIHQSFMCHMIDTEILAASIRSVEHVNQVMKMGVDVVTVPVALMEQLTMHPLTEKGIERFNADWVQTGITTFP